MQVGEVLDLGYGKQPGHPGAERQPEDGLFVEQRVENPRRTRPVEQSAGDPVDAALAGDVFAEDDGFGIAVQDVVQRAVDPDRHGHRRVGIACSNRRGQRGGRGGDRVFEAERKGRHHRLRAVELRRIHDFFCQLLHLGALGLVAVQHFRWRQHTLGHQQFRGAHQRISFIISR